MLIEKPPEVPPAKPKRNGFTGKPREEVAAATENRRRAARFHYARLRAVKMREGQPEFTEEQRAQLAMILYPEGFRK